jgi:tetratricopeptide (TPR) repeat protein
LKSGLIFGTLVAVFLLTAHETIAQRNKKNKTSALGLPERNAVSERIFTEGEKFFILEDYAKALLYFQQSLEYNADNAAVYYKVADIYAKGNKEEDLVRAAQNIENALRLEKKNKYYYQLASRIYITSRQLDKAAKTLETMLKEVKGTEDNLFDLAAIYWQNNQLDDALKTYNRAEATMGVNEISSLQKQRIYGIKGKWNDATLEGEKLMQAYPDEERYALAQAEIFSQQNKLPQAIIILEKFLDTHPDAGSSKVMLASLYRESGQEAKSREYVTRLMDDPNVEVSSKVLILGTYNAALAQVRMKKTKEDDLQDFVLGLYGKLKMRYPNSSDVCLVGGDLLLTLGKNQEARAEYSHAVRIEANHLEAWQNLLYLETQSGMSDSLIAHSEKALEIFPNQTIVYYFNGLGQMQKKNYKEAIQVLEQSKKISTTNKNLQSEIYGMLGDAYNAIHDNEKSDQAYEEALTINPNNDYVLNNYSYFLSLRKIHLEKAEKMSAQSLKIQPENTSFIDTYAWILYQLGRYKEAKKTMEKIFSLGQGSAVNYEHYGDVLYQLGNVDEAVTQWQKAKSLNGSSEVLNKKITNRKIY